MNFEEKVKSMTAAEIITTMVESLVHPTVNVDMNTYGESRQKKLLGIPYGKDVCFGCAATNTICKISGVTFTTENVDSASKRARAVETDFSFLSTFESAINYLRSGDIGSYNHFAKSYGFAQIKDANISLPLLDNNYTNAQLNVYRQLASLQ